MNARAPRLNPIAGPILGEFLLGISVALAGLWLAAQLSDAAAAAWLVAGTPATLALLNAPASVAPLAAPLLVWLAPALLLESYNLALAAILRAHLHARDCLHVMLAMHAAHLVLAWLRRRLPGLDGRHRAARRRGAGDAFVHAAAAALRAAGQPGDRLGLLASGALALVAALAAPWLLAPFTRDAQIVAAAQTLPWLSIVLEAGRVFNLVVAGALRAAGDVLVPAGASAVSLVPVLGGGSWLLGAALGLPGIWLADAADEWARGLVLPWRWRLRAWLGPARAARRTMRVRNRLRPPPRRRL